MLPSGAHIRIGSYEFLLDESVDNNNAKGGSLFRPHYKHSRQPLFSSRTALIEGAPSAENVNQNKLVWSMTDWSGGEGFRTFDPSDPSVYDFATSGINSRIRGQIACRPSRTVTLVHPLTATNCDVRDPAFFATGDQALWLCQSRDNVAYSTDGTTWTSRSQAAIGLNALSTTYKITAATGDGMWTYYAGWHSGASGTRTIRAIQQSNNSQSFRDEATGKNAWAGLAYMHGGLYAWDGNILSRFEINSGSWSTGGGAQATGGSVSGATYGLDIPSSRSLGTNWYAGLVAGTTSVYYFTSVNGRSLLFENKRSSGNDVPAPLWDVPEGFSIRTITFNSGNLYVAGIWGSDSTKGRGALYAIDVSADGNRKPVFISWFRKTANTDLNMIASARSYGNQILVAAGDPYVGSDSDNIVFVYDADFDAVSSLDAYHNLNPAGHADNTDDFYWGNASNYSVTAVTTFGAKRVVAVTKPGGAGATDTNLSETHSIQLVAYADDEPDNRQQSTVTLAATDYRFTSPTYDWDIPLQKKMLVGVHIIHEPNLTTNKQALVWEYSTDEGVNWTTPTDAPVEQSPGRTWIRVSSATNGTVTFNRLKWRLSMQTTSGTGKKPPIVYDVLVEAELLGYDEVWEMLVRVKDEQSRTRVHSRIASGGTQRDWLLENHFNRSVVTFLDGYRYKNEGDYTTHNVIIESVDDIIQTAGEGSMHIVLRRIPGTDDTVQA